MTPTSSTAEVWWDGGEPKYCLPVFGDLESYGVKVRDWLWSPGRDGRRRSGQPKVCVVNLTAWSAF